MNVRLGPGEVRLRLERSEAEALGRGEAQVGELTFPGGARLGWRVEPVPGEAPPSVVLDGAQLAFAVSAEVLRTLLSRPPSRDAALEAEVPVIGGAPLALKVEIDLFGNGKGPAGRRGGG